MKKVGGIKVPRAGNSDKFNSGKVTYLSPLPLPTGLPAVDHSHIVAEVTDEYLELGAFTPNVFGWQLTVAMPMSVVVLSVIVMPVLMFFAGLVWGNGIWDAIDTSALFFVDGLKIGAGFGIVVLLIVLFPRMQSYFQLRGVVPTRFNRQRREVCLVPSDSDTPVIVPWEELQAWVIQAQGATQYGVQRQYGLGFGGTDPKTGKGTSLELMAAGLPLAISTWEALRAYMEYEVHSLKEIQDTQELQKPGDPPWEGVHTFYNARDRMRQNRREGKVGWYYPFFWYCYHVLTLWTLPNHLTEWEVRKLKKLNRRATPEAVQRWSKPLPESEWAKPSEKLKNLSEQVHQKQRANRGRLPYEVFAEVYAEHEGRASISA